MSLRGSTAQTRVLLIAGALLVLALVLRVAYVLHTSNFVPKVDDRSYDHLARGLATGHGWVTGKSAYRPPGYPFFLAGIYKVVGIPPATSSIAATRGGGWTGARLVEALMAVGTVGLIGILAKQLLGRRVALVAIAIGAVYVPLILVGVSLMTESLLVPLTLAATVSALHSPKSEHPYRWIALAGVFAGLAALTRGNGIVLAPALACVVWRVKPRLRWQSLKAPVLLIVVALLTISPWTIRNAIAQHRFVPVTDELAATLAGTYNNVAARHHFIWQAGSHYPQYKSIRNDRKISEVLRTTRLQSAVFAYIGQHPLDVPQAMFWNTVRLVDLQGRKVSRSSARADVQATAGFADLGVYVFWFFGLLALVGLFTHRIRGVPRAIWLVPFFIWLSEAPITTGTPRFRAALDPWIILLAASGVVTVIGVGSRAMSRRRTPPAVPAVSGAPARRGAGVA